ncbi:Ceramide glucosyltransferase [Oleoguttula sp. CCFEE 5521]
MFGVDAEVKAPSYNHGASAIPLWIASICLGWYVFITLVCSIGYIQIRRHYSRVPQHVQWGSDAPDVTIIRPVKGLEPSMYDCLASTFRQRYPKDKLHVRFCVSSSSDPALPVLQRLIEDFSDRDARILIKDDDPVLSNGGSRLGPNPKIRNMSRAYLEAVGNRIWIIDCNVWVASGVCARMVATLEGHGQARKNKFVHQLPLVVDTVGTSARQETHGLLDASNGHLRTIGSSSIDTLTKTGEDRTASSIGGGRLEEMFLGSAHAKFYIAINTVLVAPCIVGKSTMFRRSHLDSLTNGKGIDFFSENICEDHLIGDLLWKQQVPEELQGEKWGKHACYFGDLAIQPMANMSVKEYWSRRVRWLRVRKFTVTLATLVEPGTESCLCSLYGAFAVTTLPVFHDKLSVPHTWTSFALFWLLSVSIWCAADWTLYNLLHSSKSVEVDEDTPSFARPPSSGSRRPFGQWVFAWVGREALALPIWLWAFWGGTTVEWRGKKFWVGMDMKVHEIVGSVKAR